MFSFLSAVIFSMSSNLDNFVIGIAFGIKKIKIGFLPNLLIALITVAGTVASMYAGKIAASFLPRGLTDLLGASIIILLGLYFVLQSFSNLLNRKKRIRSIALKDADSMIDYAQDSDKDVSGSIDIRESAAVQHFLSHLRRLPRRSNFRQSFRKICAAAFRNTADRTGDHRIDALIPSLRIA